VVLWYHEFSIARVLVGILIDVHFGLFYDTQFCPTVDRPVVYMHHNKLNYTAFIQQGTYH